ncbi:MAG: hypothetical protein EPN85_08800 [Bacteroidetes bacterium]|nr:MAG: hypothetical protein EPN85_08800 [Bacteroidota bacterium]
MKKCCILFFLFWGINLFSQSFYVDGTNGNDNNSGTSLVLAWKTIQHAFDNATPGSTVFIRGGTYYENVYANVSGTVGNPIIFRNYQTELVLLDGTGTSQTDMLYIEDQSNLIIKNITIQNRVVNYATGVVISCTANSAVSNITLKNLKITGINWTTIPNAVPTSNNNSNPLLVYGSGTNQSNAITNIIVDSCEVYNNITGFSESIALDGNVDGFTVSNNSVHDNKNIGIDMAGNYKVSSNPLVDQARNGNCIQNICYNNISSYAASGGIYVDGGRDILIEKNTCCGNGWGIEIGCEENGSTSNIIVRDNVIYNNREAGLSIGGYTNMTTGQVLNSSILNNTFLKNDYSNSGLGEIYITKMSNCKIQSNIIYTNAQNILMYKDNIAPSNNNSINYNCWYTPNNNSNGITISWNTSTYNSFATYQTQTGMDANSIYSDPGLTNSTVSAPDFHILQNNPCIDSGDPNYAIILTQTDYYGNPRISGAGVDIGVHEFSSPNGILNDENEIFIQTYPNPFHQSIEFVMSAPESGIKNAELRITDVFGKVVIKETVPDSEKCTIQRGHLPAGMYFFKIGRSGNDLCSGKIIIQ